MRFNGNWLKFPTKTDSGKQIFIRLVDCDLHCYLPLSAFGIESKCTGAYCAVVGFAAKASKRSWCGTKAIVEKVHKHACGHAYLRDMQILVERNDIWSDDVNAYLYQTIDLCCQCKVTEERKGMRKVSFHDLSSFFNDRVCLDHIFWKNSLYCTSWIHTAVFLMALLYLHELFVKLMIILKWTGYWNMAIRNLSLLIKQSLRKNTKFTLILLKSSYFQYLLDDIIRMCWNRGTECFEISFFALRSVILILDILIWIFYNRLIEFLITCMKMI